MRACSLVDSEDLRKEIVVLSPEESHYLACVLRIRTGQAVTLFDGRGGIAKAIVEEVSKTAVKARIFRCRHIPAPEVEIDLIQALPRPDRWELVLQKAVELGTTGIRPVITQHTEYRPVPRKEERWRRIVRSAARQCEVRWIPELQSLEKIDDVFPALEKYDLALIGSLYKNAKRLREIPIAGKTRVALLIGPEGDFTEEEIEAAIQAGAIAVSFGKRILRTETAAIFGLSVLAYELL